MAKDVTKTLIEILVAKGRHSDGKSYTTEDAEKLIDEMKRRSRYVLDIWS
jgi:sulfite reductase alpha subunit-like flavoprotein